MCSSSVPSGRYSPARYPFDGQSIERKASEAVRNCSFAEIMVPQNLLSMGMPAADLPIVDSEGFIGAPHKPGLGYDIDRDAVDNLTPQRF
jgi:hypothetical protein